MGLLLPEGGAGAVAGVDGVVLGDLLGFLEAPDHVVGAGPGEIPSADAAMEEEISAKPFSPDLDDGVARSVAGEVVIAHGDAGDVEHGITGDSDVRLRGWCALTERVAGEHESILIGDVEGDAECLLQGCVAPSVVEMAVGVEDRYGIVCMGKHPLRRADPRIDDEGFVVDRDEVAVGLVVPHGTGLDLHGWLRLFECVRIPYFFGGIMLL